MILTTFILVAGTPGFAGQWQLGGEGDNNNNDILYLFCDWNTSWSLIYRPIDEKQRTEIDKIVKVPKYQYFILHFYLRIAACKIYGTRITRSIKSQKSSLFDTRLTRFSWIQI